MNKSSSFYSEAYYQKARKQSHKKKPIYRQRNKQLYDQQHQLDILKYYNNRSGRCEMIRYYEFIAGLFFEMKEKNIKGSDQYNQTVTEYIAKVNQKIKYFHQFLECTDYENREQRIDRMRLEAKGQQTQEAKGQQTQEAKGQQTQAQRPQEARNNIRITRLANQGERQGQPKRLDTCNQCPIFIEQYEFNFERATTLIAKQNSYWDKLNGNQKLAKFRKYIQQNLKILKYELETKCSFATKTNHNLPRKLFGRP